MVSHITTVAFRGIEIDFVDVQVKIMTGLPAFTVVGLPDKAISESRERVRSAIASVGLAVPSRRITVNMSPADLPKEGSHFDLPIALAILAAMDVIPQSALSRYVALGELSLDASILPVSGVLPAAIAANSKDMGLICPKVNGAEAVWASSELEVVAAGSLLELINHLTGNQLQTRPEKNQSAGNGSRLVDFRDVKGQESAKRAALIAAAGGHNLLMMGPPGSGKSMIASCIAGISPEMTPEEILESSMIHSISGLIRNGELSGQRPFRDPHHSTSVPAMVGGGRNPKPGEISLAHNGVLFMDELPEFPRAVLESLRQPLESGYVSVARVNGHITYPANFQLIAAMNPCRCGYLGDVARECGKAPKCASEYMAKLSGPLIDRIDIFVEVPSLPPDAIFAENPSRTSNEVEIEVSRVREIQKERFENFGIQSIRKTNSELEGEHLEKAIALNEEAKKLLIEAAGKLRLSMRSHSRVQKVARTIADLDDSEDVGRTHVAEALSYRTTTFNF